MRLLGSTQDIATSTVTNGSPLSGTGVAVFMTVWAVGALVVGFLLWRRGR